MIFYKMFEKSRLWTRKIGLDFFVCDLLQMHYLVFTSFIILEAPCMCTVELTAMTNLVIMGK